jgi:hypothetical protein
MDDAETTTGGGVFGIMGRLWLCRRVRVPSQPAETMLRSLGRAGLVLGEVGALGQAGVGTGHGKVLAGLT